MKIPFDEVFEDKTKYGTKIKTDDYHDAGAHIIIDQGQEQIAGYTDLEEGLFTDVPAIIFGDHTRIVKYVDTPFFLGADGVKVLRSRYENANYKYLYFVLKNARIPNTGYNRHFKWLKELQIPYPDSDIQAKIVSILEKASAIVEKRQQQLSALDDLIKARFVEMFGEPEHNSKSWPVQPLDSLCSVGSSKRIYQNEQSADGVPFWRISDLVSKMDTGVADSGLFIPEEKYLELRQSGLVPMAGDILVTSRGTLGRCYIIQEEDRFYFQDGMISWLSNYAENITPLYLQHLFTMNGFRKQIDGMQAGSTVAYLSIAMLKKLRIMVPSEEMQSEFAAFVAQIDKTKSVIQKSLDETQLLFDSLMQKYFG